MIFSLFIFIEVISVIFQLKDPDYFIHFYFLLSLAFLASLASLSSLASIVFFTSFIFVHFYF